MISLSEAEFGKDAGHLTGEAVGELGADGALGAGDRGSGRGEASDAGSEAGGIGLFDKDAGEGETNGADFVGEFALGGGLIEHAAERWIEKVAVTATLDTVAKLGGEAALAVEGEFLVRVEDGAGGGGCHAVHAALGFTSLGGEEVIRAEGFAGLDEALAARRDAAPVVHPGGSSWLHALLCDWQSG